MRYLAVLLGFSMFVSADARRPASADTCDVLATRVIAKVGGKIVRRGADGVVLIEHPEARELLLACGAASPALSAVAESHYPPPAFDRLAGQAGQVVTGIDRRAIARNAVRCRQALRSAERPSIEIQADGGAFRCEAITMGERGVKLTISRPGGSR
jgi:hypothetical protein